MSKGNRVQDSLRVKRLISPSFVSLPRGRKKVLILTNKGSAVLGIGAGTSLRHGGPEHQHWVRVLAQRLKAMGCKVEVEVPVGKGRTVDIVASRNGERTACEVETGASDVSANIRKCQEAGFDQIFVVFTSSEARERFMRNATNLKSARLVTTTEFCRSER